MRSRVLITAFVILLCCTKAAWAAPPPDASLFANPFEVRVGERVTFTGFVGSGTTLPVVLTFGDGQDTLVTTATFSLSHAYSHPGEAIAFLRTLSGAFLDAAAIEVVADSPRVPLGAIYSTTINISPVLAGSVVSVSLTYRIAVPGAGYPSLPSDELPGLQLIVDLEDSNGNLIHRGDPTLLYPLRFDAMQHTTVSYSVPVDARGTYRVRAYIQAVDRGTIAIGAPTPLDVIGNSPNDSVDARGVHISGSVEAGRRPQIIGETINPGMTLSSQQRLSTSALSAFSDPTSNRVDPLLVLTSLLPARLSSPNALDTQPKQPPTLPYVTEHRAQYYDAFGRLMAAMPDILGGFSTVRGVSGTYRTAPGWTFQGSAGNTELYSATFGEPRTFEQFGDVFELGRFWSASDGVQIFHHGRGDNSSRFFFFPQGAQIADVNAIQGTRAVNHNLSLAASAAFSGYYPSYGGGPTTSDSANLFSGDYHNGFTNLTLQYHNFGRFFASGNGMLAMSDRAGMIASALVPLSKRAKFGLNWDREGTRSYAATQTTTSALFNYEFDRGVNALAQVSRDRELTQLTDVKTDTVALHLGRSDVFHNFLVDGVIISSHDFVSDLGSFTVRTGSIQYSFQHGIQAIGFGVNAVQNGGFFESSVVTESMTDGIAFGGAQRKLGVQVGLANSNTQFDFGGGSDAADLTSSLTYNITRGVTVGFKGERTLFTFHNSPFGSVAGGIRFMLIVNR
jgi:hypothetical protein